MTTFLKAPSNGFIIIYVSNEGSMNDVFFDDMHVTVTESPVIQAEDYYPFGLQFNSYSRVTAKQNDYLYNGKELHDELDLNWLDYGARMYMPEIGRWGVVDPLASDMASYSPYNYVFNNPLIFIDPDGMSPDYGEVYDDLGPRLIFPSMFKGSEGSGFGGYGSGDSGGGSLGGSYGSGEGGGSEQHSSTPGTKIDLDTDLDLLFAFQRARIAAGVPVGGNGRGFLSGFGDGFGAGVGSTIDFFKSLGTAKGWQALGQGAVDLADLACITCPLGIIKRGQLADATVNYVQNISNMSSYQIGFDVGFGTEKLTEIALTRRVMPISKASVGLRTMPGASAYTTIQTLNTYGKWGKLGSRFRTLPYGALTIDRATFINRNFIIPFGRTIGFGQLQYLQND